MTPSIRRAALVLFGVLAVAVVVWNLVPQVPAGSSHAPAPTYTSPPPAAATVAGNPVPSQPAQSALREYAIEVEELQGLPPDVVPGTRLELWVTWERAAGGAPKLQKLMANASLARVVPSLTPQGPTTAILGIPVHRMPDLLYADGYGRLSVTVVP
ncbi:MAG TPA: hypothetical protein VIG64_09605 [Actinomycetota bacterium]